LIARIDTGFLWPSFEFSTATSTTLIHVLLRPCSVSAPAWSKVCVTLAIGVLLSLVHGPHGTAPVPGC